MGRFEIFALEGQNGALGDGSCELLREHGLPGVPRLQELSCRAVVRGTATLPRTAGAPGAVTR